MFSAKCVCMCLVKQVWRSLLLKIMTCKKFTVYCSIGLWCLDVRPGLRYGTVTGLLNSNSASFRCNTKWIEHLKSPGSPRPLLQLLIRPFILLLDLKKTFLLTSCQSMPYLLSLLQIDFSSLDITLSIDNLYILDKSNHVIYFTGSCQLPAVVNKTVASASY